ncbi:recombinase family protein [Butyrivibrio sp. INlla14]|uniref:recombinase family protein n=1 Tax=Butyrivibrio sp. INlla14 TaxID=1520808 RepID=UPI0008768106|nr:recombinase family protein [Butyrivibrio sp. INlla14]SCY62733.1 Site-specific DNA recombinase [Butyrivibrio sp. INlla14]
MSRKAAIYARVSTEHEAQISALENQVQYYDEILARHPDWELVDRYIDEGITGTSINKRPSFLKMMADAKAGMFDLIITREVSRFARNTVDTLQQTRILKALGVEVWFTEDNIWTLNDEDGELRLSIMATLAQNESKKISQRVKAGQMISFKNGVLYGNGNILGYDRVGGNLVLNKDQAKTVRRIFDLYLNGNGVRRIQDLMEKEGYKTASGLTHWHAGNINRILHNSFYCGRIEYRKQYVPDYLTQKKINNHGDVERIYVDGTQEPIITPEEFDRVQSIMQTRTAKTKKGTTTGGCPAKNIWGKKLRCKCGHAMHRRVNHINANGFANNSFQCYEQLRTGTIKHRLKKGLPVDGICDNSTFAEWKLDVQREFIFKKFVGNKQEVYSKAVALIKDIEDLEASPSDNVASIKSNQDTINKINNKIANLVDLYMDGDITREVFRDKKARLENQIEELEKQNTEYRKQITKDEDSDVQGNRMENLAEILNMKAYAKNKKVPDTIVDYYVYQIIYDHDVFSWYLNPKLGNECMAVDCTGFKRKAEIDKLMSTVHSGTGSYRRKALIKNEIF